MHTATFRIDFVTQDGHVAGHAHREVQLAFAPSTELEYEQSAWRDPRKASSVSFNLDDSTFFVHFGVQQLEPGVNIQRNLDMFRIHDWEVGPEDLLLGASG